MRKLFLVVLATAMATGSVFAQSAPSPTPSPRGIEAEGDSGPPRNQHGVNMDADERAKADRKGEPTTMGSGLRDRPVETPATERPSGTPNNDDRTPSGLTRD
jgi:hypothetical protein